MLFEGNYLAHYGIKGQKWGVRRFQNEDGSYTAEGRKRYAPKFESAEKLVRQKLSNKVYPFKRKPIDIDAVRNRGKLSLEEAEECANIAKQIFSSSVKAEPKITRDVISAISKSSGHAYGLEYRLKQPTSLASKIGADAKKDKVSFEEASRGINDTIRYTTVSEDDSFTSDYKTIKSELERMGYFEVRCKNYFDAYKKGQVMHKAVQSVYRNEDNKTFEIQFQTPSSQAAKDLRTPIYEKRRRSGLSEQEKSKLEQQMLRLAEFVPYPQNVFNIKSHL